MLSYLKEAGCRQILFGRESGSQKILDAMKKGITTDQIPRAVHLTKKAGIKTMGFFILGYPGETEETLKDTVKLIEECSFDDIGVFLFTPLPGSEVYQDVRDYGMYNEDWEKMNALDQVVFIPESLTADKLKEYSNRCNNACYLRVGQILSIIKRCSSIHHFKAIVKSIPKLMFADQA